MRLKNPEFQELKAGLQALALLKGDLEIATITKSNELRYTMGPVYSPGVLDAHNEFATAEDLHKAMWEMQDNWDGIIYKQHKKGTNIGKVRELFQWPAPAQFDLKLPDGTVTKSVTFPADTVYAGIQWTEDAWPDVKSGKIRGLSMGGRAVRMRGVEAGDMKKLS